MKNNGFHGPSMVFMASGPVSGLSVACQGLSVACQGLSVVCQWPVRPILLTVAWFSRSFVVGQHVFLEVSSTLHAATEALRGPDERLYCGSM